MTIPSYTFQSPSNSQVQVGKLDPSSTKEEQTKTPSQEQTNQTDTKKPTTSPYTLDIYA